MAFRSLLGLVLLLAFLPFFSAERQNVTHAKAAGKHNVTHAKATGKHNVTHTKGLTYDIYCVGNCNRDVSPQTQFGIAMMGGGTDVDEAFEWMIDLSNGGDFVVLRTSGGDDYNDYIYDLGDSNSVTTIIINSRSGSSAAEVLTKVRNAEALFLAGGDQSTYVDYWAGTLLETAMNDVINDKGIPFGGTSAGLHVQGEFVYTGERGSAVSNECLNFPYNPLITLSSGFLDVPFLYKLLGESHFYDRDRMGRTITFLARLIQDGYTSSGVTAVAVDEETALLVNDKGIGSVVGYGMAYFLQATRAPTVCRAGSRLSIDSILVYKIDDGSFRGNFDLVSWRGAGGRQYYIDVEDGQMYSTQSGGSVY